MARVYAEPEPLGPLSAHRLRRLLTGPRAIAIALVSLGVTGVSVLVILTAASGPGRSVNTHLAGTMVVLGGHAELRLAGMPQPPIGEIYEIWLTRSGSNPTPTNALFTPSTAGTATVLVPGSLRRVREITVTAEPVGGSGHPSSPVILSVALSPRAGG